MSKVKGWKASYYHDSQRKWLYGELLLYPRCIRFVEDGEHERTDFRLFYDEFVELRKDTTNVFYAAITIRIKDEKYWFSSVTDRGSVFNNIEHFWKERLFASGLAEDTGGPENTEAKSSEGKELLNILYDSQDTLVSTAKTFHRQGQQIDAACRTMNRLHNDLDVAETIVHSLDSWLDKWNVDTPLVRIDVPDNIEMIEKTEYPVLYSGNIGGKQLPGSLVVSNQCIEILDAERNTKFYFVNSQVSEVTVHTPWQIIISKYAFGKSDLSVYITSARMMYILKILEVTVGAKMNYDEPPVTSTICADIEGATGSSNAQDEGESFSTQKSTQGHSATAFNNTQQHSKVISEAEAAQMSQVLQDMRSMALGIQEEQDRQLKQLDNLSDSVDKANERIRKDTRKVNKLA